MSGGPWLISYIVLWAVVLLQGAVIFVLLRQLGLMYLGTAQGVARDGLAVGQRAPDFSLPDLAGGVRSLHDAPGLPLLLVFGSASCAPCRGLMPDLNAFARERGTEFSTLYLMRGDLDEARRFAEELDVSVPVAVHPDHALADEYKARVTPFAFVISGEGVVLAKGLANNRDHLEMLLRASRQETRRSEKHGRNGAGEATPSAVGGAE